MGAVQILGLRKFTGRDGEEKMADRFHEKNWRAASVKELLQPNFPQLGGVPEGERWNLFYTLAECSEEKRKFLRQTVLAFDIDSVPEPQRQGVFEVVCKTLGFDPHETAGVSSGGGLHVIIELATPVESAQYFKDQKPAYDAACDKIDLALRTTGLEGHADKVLFEPRRILRLPSTTNRKAGKPERLCFLMHPLGAAQAFDLSSLHPLGGPLKKDDALRAKDAARITVTDTDAVLQGCSFLAHVREKRGVVPEPWWYAALSIAGRLSPAGDGKTGREIGHEMSDGHPGYIPEETDRKIDQALLASGPRTCPSIGSFWEGCTTCPHKGKIAVPLQIVAEGRVATELTGFHQVSPNGKATPKPGDLRDFFIRAHSPKTMESRQVLVWTEAQYEEISDALLENYAQDHFAPSVPSHVAKEFRLLVAQKNVRSPRWFAETTEGSLNLRNGVLNIKTKVLEPHTPNRGFRYTLPYDFNPEAKAPRFERMLQLVTGDDKSLTDILLEFMGYCLSGDSCWTHKALVLEGSGSNGKSTFLDILKYMAGKNSYATARLNDLESEYTRAQFEGKLFNISEETPTRAMLDSGIFKSLVAGNEISARSPFKDVIKFENRAKLVMACNALPDSRDPSFGYLRRFLIVPFNQLVTRATVDDFDPHLATKIKNSELPGVLNLAIEGYRRLVHQGEFTKSAASDEKLKEYAMETNTVTRWYRDNAVLLTNGHADTFTSLDKLFLDYRQLSKDHELRPVTYDKFAKELKSLIPDYKNRCQRRRVDGSKNPKRGFLGIGLSMDFAAEEPEGHVHV